jgi:hypothetical protein
MRHSIFSTSIFLYLTSTITNALPITSDSQTPEDCAYGTCSPRLQLVGTPISQPPPSRQHDIVQIEIEITERIQSFDNSVFSPSRNTPPSEALSIHKPLSTTYLQSLSQATQSIEEKVAKYLSSHPSSLSRASNAVKNGKKPCRKEWLVYLPGNVYVSTRQHISRKPDAALVGIVLIFLALVVLAECVDRFVQHVREQRAERRGRGEIYLEEKDGEVRIIGEGISVVAWEDEKAALIREFEV